MINPVGKALQSVLSAYCLTVAQTKSFSSHGPSRLYIYFVHVFPFFFADLHSSLPLYLFQLLSQALWNAMSL